jgi:hypothetical protein
MDTEKIQIVLGENVNKAELIIREGTAVKELEPKAPVKTNIQGVIGTPLEYLTKRIGTGQFSQERAVLFVDREKISIQLVFNENDEYNRGVVTGILEQHPKFVKFQINSGEEWRPQELGLFFKMNRSFFPDLKENMRLVSDLMNFTATVNNKIERSIKESGSKTDNFSQVVNSNLPEKFILNIPVFKGTLPETVEVETFAKINGHEVSFILLSPGAQTALEDIRNRIIDEQLEKIKDVAPFIAIIEI